jgi:hypothetical protein
MSTADSTADRPADAITVTGHIEYTSKPTSDAQVDLVRRSSQERMRRAAIGWAACWGLAVAAVFIPLLHFILVPALVIAGPLVGRARWREKATVLRIRGTCPGCEKPQAVDLKQPASESMPWRCPECGRPLVLRLDPVVFESAA